MATRDRKGRFLARKRGARRANPGVPVMFANPTHRKPRRRRASAGKRALVVRVGNPTHRTTRKTHRRRHYGIRRNPGGWGMILRVGVAGGLGIIASRAVKFYGAKYLPASMQTGWLGLAVNTGLSVGAIWALAKLAQKIKASHTDVLAFSVGGYAETARSAIGGVVGTLAPSFGRGAVGLDAPAAASPAMVADAEGRVYELDAAGNYQLSGLLEADAIGDLIEEEAF